MFCITCGSQSMCVWVGLDCVWIGYVRNMSSKVYLSAFFEYIKWIPTQAFGLVLFFFFGLYFHCGSAGGCSCFFFCVWVQFRHISRCTNKTRERRTKINYVISMFYSPFFLSCFIFRCRAALSSMPAFLSPVTAE